MTGPALPARPVDVEPPLWRQVEEAGLNASAAPQQRWLDGWIVRTCPGKAKRSRCINAVSAGHGDLVNRLARCEAWYAECGLPPVFRITPFSQPPELDAWLAQRGWSRFDDTQVMVLASLAAAAQVWTSASGSAPRAAQFGLVERPLDGAAYAQAVGSLRGSSPTEVLAHAQRLASCPVPYVGLAWLRDGQVVVCGQFAREDALVGLYDVHTAAAARGRGLATALCGRLLQQALEEGAHSAYLQVDKGNGPARAVYRRLGFQDAYAYHYRAPAHSG